MGVNFKIVYFCKYHDIKVDVAQSDDVELTPAFRTIFPMDGRKKRNLETILIGTDFVYLFT